LENVLFLASLTAHTGNAITAARIASILPAKSVSSLDVNKISGPMEVTSKLHECGASLVFGVHAYRAGKLLLDCCVPFIIILGGTDMNEHVHEKDKGEIIRKAIGQAAGIVAFDDNLLSVLLGAAPEAKPKTFLIPQSVEVGDNRMLMPSPEIRHRLGVQSGDLLLLLPAGLRPVKDVLYAVRAVCAWHDRDPRVKLRIVGPILDQQYAQSVEDALCSCASIVKYCGVLPRDELHSAMAAADVVLNTSTSEGMCNSLLEAMLLGTPVVARSNSGNAALISDGVTGILFDTPQELVSKAEQLLSAHGRATANRLVEAAREDVRARHSLKTEAASYTAVVEHALMART
jgi:glycosyltransferase involved in cell wall biosynthesis